jgi:hypothetical protein
MGQWSYKSAFDTAQRESRVTCRFYDARHTFVTRLAENPAISIETIRQLAGHVNDRMLARYAHIRVQERRDAIAALEKNRVEGFPSADERGWAQNWAQSAVGRQEASRHCDAKPLKSKDLSLVGVAGFEPATTRTPSVCATRLRYTPTPRKAERRRRLYSHLLRSYSGTREGFDHSPPIPSRSSKRGAFRLNKNRPFSAIQLSGSPADSSQRNSEIAGDDGFVRGLGAWRGESLPTWDCGFLRATSRRCGGGFDGTEKALGKRFRRQIRARCQLGPLGLLQI